MDTQQIVNALLLVPAAVLGVVAVRASRAGRTSLGIDPRRGAWRELLVGVAFGAIAVAVLSLAFWALGRGPYGDVSFDVGPLAGIAVYFLLLFVVEEIVFRGLLMTGTGVLAGQAVALVVVAVLVAVPYAFADGSGVLPVVGAVLTNVLNGLARWRTGRIWFGVGMRWVWNTGQVALGYTVSGYTLGGDPLLGQRLDGPAWLTGGVYGPEGGVVGACLRVVMIAALVLLAARLYRPWTVSRR